MSATAIERIPGPIRQIAAFTLAAGFAAFYLVYLGGFERIRDLVR